jgi:transposase-like protein
VKASGCEVELSRNHFHNQEAFVLHGNAALTPRARLRLARLILDHGWSPARAAERYDVSWRTAAKWAARYRTEGEAGMTDRSSRPHRQPTLTPSPTIRKIVHLRRKRRLGPVPIADQLGLAASTVHAALRRHRLNRLSHLERGTGEPIRRYEHDHPGDLLHIDVKNSATCPMSAAGGTSAASKARRTAPPPSANPAAR